MVYCAKCMTDKVIGMEFYYSDKMTVGVSKEPQVALFYCREHIKVANLFV